MDEFIKVLIVLVVLMTVAIVYLLNQQNETENMTEENIFEDLMVNEEENDDSIPDLENKKENQNELERIEPEKIIIDLKGAVQFPGVYEMENNTRIIDCIEKAGGLLDNAEEKAINLAQKLEDQMVIYIPTEGEELENMVQIVESVSNNDSTENDASQKMDLNKATKEELKSLNGVGDVKAENIVSYREDNGNFKKIDDIKNVSGIGESTFEKLKEEIKIIP